MAAGIIQRARVSLCPALNGKSRPKTPAIQNHLETFWSWTVVAGFDHWSHVEIAGFPQSGKSRLCGGIAPEHCAFHNKGEF